MRVIADLSHGKVLSRVYDFRPGVLLHAFSQCCYIVASFFLFALERPPYWWLVLLLFGTFYYGLHLFFVRKKCGEYIALPLVGIGITNSVFINLEGYSLWTYLLAAFLGISAISIFSDQRSGHAFNASALGILVVVMFFPAWCTTPTWSQPFWFYGLILLLGNATAAVNRRLYLSYSYLASFTLISILVWLIMWLASGTSVHGFSLLFWPSVLFTPGTLIWMFHVISDPGTSPSGVRQQILYGAAIGILDFFLRAWCHFVLSDFIAYAIVQLIYWWGLSSGVLHQTPRTNPKEQLNFLH